jgi:hypothetical protein
MVQRVQTLFLDDLDGSEAAETVVFALDDATYEIDLSADHGAQLRAGLESWIEAGRRLKNGGKAAASRKPAPAAGETAKIRAWAREQGMKISDRGRIPLEVREAYGAAR